MQFRKFEPMVRVIFVEDLLKRGGNIVRESKNEIVIERMGKIATVDEWGRVEWSEVPKERT